MAQLLRVASTVPYLLVLGGSVASILPVHVLMATVLSLPAARHLIEFAIRNHRVPSRIAALKNFATQWHIAFGLSLVLGLVASRVNL